MGVTPALGPLVGKDVLLDRLQLHPERITYAPTTPTQSARCWKKRTSPASIRGIPTQSLILKAHPDRSRSIGWNRMRSRIAATDSPWLKRSPQSHVMNTRVASMRSGKAQTQRNIVRHYGTLSHAASPDTMTRRGNGRKAQSTRHGLECDSGKGTRRQAPRRGQGSARV
jgi:hypothetical protein